MQSAVGWSALAATVVSLFPPGQHRSLHPIKVKTRATLGRWVEWLNWWVGGIVVAVGGSRASGVKLWCCVWVNASVALWFVEVVCGIW